MFISLAHAAGEVGTATTPATADTFWMNMGLIGLMFVLFYLLLIRPQQRRLKEQRDMLDTLKKGDEVVTSGGLVATVTKIISETEVEIELAKDVRVTALRYTIQMKASDAVKAVKPVEKKAAAETKPAPVVAEKPAVVKKKEVAAPKKAAPKAKAAPKKAAAKKAAPKKSTTKK